MSVRNGDHRDIRATSVSVKTAFRRFWPYGPGRIAGSWRSPSGCWCYGAARGTVGIRMFGIIADGALRQCQPEQFLGQACDLAGLEYAPFVHALGPR